MSACPARSSLVPVRPLSRWGPSLRAGQLHSHHQSPTSKFHELMSLQPPVHPLLAQSPVNPHLGPLPGRSNQVPKDMSPSNTIMSVGSYKSCPSCSVPGCNPPLWSRSPSGEAFKARSVVWALHVIGTFLPCRQ